MRGPRGAGRKAGSPFSQKRAPRPPWYPCAVSIMTSCLHTFTKQAPRLEERWCFCRGAPAGVHRGVPASLARQVLCDTSWQERAPPPPETAQAGSGESASAAAAAMASADAFAPDQLTCPSPSAHAHTGRAALS